VVNGTSTLRQMVGSIPLSSMRIRVMRSTTLMTLIVAISRAAAQFQGENFRSTCLPLPNTVMFALWEMEMARTNLGSMSVDALLKLRDDIEKVLSSKANELKNQLARLGSEIGPRMRGRGSSLKGRKVAIKYRDKSGNTWAGRGAQPVWLREKLKAGVKLEDFAVQKTVASRKASPKKSRKRRRAKR
jgi:DNA-binding protein H-NS